MKVKIVTGALALVGFLGLAGCANLNANASTPQKSASIQQAQFTPQQEQEISAIVAKTLINNPTILVQSIQALKQQQSQAMNQQATNAILSNAAVLISDPLSPVIGNANAPVTLIEFYDYQCAYCHQAFPVVEQIISAYPDVRVVFKEFPIFGKTSIYAAKMSLASYQQGKFEVFHNALFNSGLMEGQLTEKDVDAIANKSGIDMAAAKAFITSDKAQAELNQNQALAGNLGAQGTPDFIVLPTSQNPDQTKITYLQGAVPVEDLEQAIKKVLN